MMKTLSLFKIIIPIILLWHTSLSAQETKITNYPDEWPSDIPKITDLSKISGYLTINEKRTNIDLTGRVTTTGDEAFKAYVNQLKNAGFDTLNITKEFDMNRGQFEKDDYFITVGSDIINQRTKNEFHEIGISISIRK